MILVILYIGHERVLQIIALDDGLKGVLRKVFTVNGILVTGLLMAKLFFALFLINQAFLKWEISNSGLILKSVGPNFKIGKIKLLTSNYTIGWKNVEKIDFVEPSRSGSVINIHLNNGLFFFCYMMDYEYGAKIVTALKEFLPKSCFKNDETQ